MSRGYGRQREVGSASNPKATTRRGSSVGSGRRETLDIQLKLMLITAIVSLIVFGICSLLYVSLYLTMARSGLIGLLFAILYTSTATVVAVYSAFNDCFSENPFTGGGLGVNILFLIGGVFVVFVMGMILQALYGLGGNTSDLLTIRYMTDMGMLYGFLRILFCTVMGTIIGIGHAVAFGRSDSLGFTFFASVIKALAASLILEGGLQLLNAPLWLACSLYWIIVGTAVLMGPSRRVRKQSRNVR